MNLDGHLNAAGGGVDDLPDPAACGDIDTARRVRVQVGRGAGAAQDQVRDFLRLCGVHHERGRAGLDLRPQRLEQVLLDLGDRAAGEGERGAVEGREHGRVGGAGSGCAPLAGAVVVAGQAGHEPVVVVGVGRPVVGGGQVGGDRVLGALPGGGQVRGQCRGRQRVVRGDHRRHGDRVGGGGRVVVPGGAVAGLEPVVGDGAAECGGGRGDRVGRGAGTGRTGRGRAPGVPGAVVIAAARPARDTHVHGGRRGDRTARGDLGQRRRGRGLQRERLPAKKLPVIADQHLVEDVESCNSERVSVTLGQVKTVLRHQTSETRRLVPGLEILLQEHSLIGRVVEAHGQVRLRVGQVHDRAPDRIGIPVRGCGAGHDVTERGDHRDQGDKAGQVIGVDAG